MTGIFGYYPTVLFPHNLQFSVGMTEPFKGIETGENRLLMAFVPAWVSFLIRLTGRSNNQRKNRSKDCSEVDP